MVKYWANTLTLNMNKELSTSMGTFGTMILDSRESMENMLLDSKKLMKREKNDIGVVIYKGDIRIGKIVKIYLTPKYRNYKKGEYLLEDMK